MLSNPKNFRGSASARAFFTALIFIGCLLILTVNIRAGFLYVLNENSSSNQIYGYNVNETTGALSLLNGFPIASGGIGLNAVVSSDRMAIDRVNRRLYITNDSSDTVSAFSINSKTGALTPLPFSPIALSSGAWFTIAVHPSGSPLIVGSNDATTPVVASFNITATTATAGTGSPFSTGTLRFSSSAFSRDGNFIYLGGGTTSAFAGFSANSSTGVLTALPGSPYDSGAATPTSFATDSQGRLFMANYQLGTVRAFTTANGVPSAVKGNPFESNVATSGDGVLHPNQNFYYVADRSISRVLAFQIVGSGATTTLTPVIPFGSSTGALANVLIFNNNGAFLYVANANSRKIATYSVNALTGVMTFVNVQPNNALGTTGLLNGIAYQPTSTTPFDFDGDGKTDISIFRPSVGEWWYYRSSDGGNYAAQFGNSTDKLVPGDFTGDGRADIAVWRPVSGEWFILRSEDGSYYSYPFGISGDIPAVGDFDGDGKADSAVFRPSDTNWYIRRSSDGGTTIQQFGASGDVPVVSDYDGDGKSDIAIYRASVGEWWIQKSSNAAVVAFQFGNSSDKPVQGDYTGDGKADVAIYRPSTGEWFILRSEDFSYYSYPFGTNGDVPAPGDYDGDGRFDATVFRPSSSTWYVQRSTAGTLIQGFGINGDTPVPNSFVP